MRYDVIAHYLHGQPAPLETRAVNGRAYIFSKPYWLIPADYANHFLESVPKALRRDYGVLEVFLNRFEVAEWSRATYGEIDPDDLDICVYTIVRVEEHTYEPA